MWVGSMISQIKELIEKRIRRTERQSEKEDGFLLFREHTTSRLQKSRKCGYIDFKYYYEHHTNLNHLHDGISLNSVWESVESSVSMSEWV